MLFYQAQQSHQPLSVHRNHICIVKPHQTYAFMVEQHNSTILTIRRNSSAPRVQYIMSTYT